jgi:hypothetical protein
MKNIKRLLLATAALVSASSMAFGPGMIGSEEAPIGLSVGANTNMIMPNRGTVDTPDRKFGVDKVGGGIGFRQNIGFDVAYNVSVGGSWASAGGTRLFTDEVKMPGDKSAAGFRLDAEIGARFMPEMADGFRLGGMLGINWGMGFSDADKTGREVIAFGGAGVRVGPAMSMAFSDMVAMYVGVNYTLTNIGFAKSDAPDLVKENLKKEYFFRSGIEAPIGVVITVADNMGVFLEANTQFTDFGKFMDTWKEGVTLGMSIAL